MKVLITGAAGFIGSQLLEALAAARDRGNRLLSRAAELDRPAQDIRGARRPSPRPPATARPAALSVTQIETLVRERNIGGLIFFQGGPVRQARLTNRLQAAARTPLLVARRICRRWLLLVAQWLDSPYPLPVSAAVRVVANSVTSRCHN